jgi:hypothetical protein
MANDKKDTIVTLVALERSFYGGRLVERGSELQFNTVDAEGKPRKLPKWAIEKDDPKLAGLLGKKQMLAGDLRPVDAQKASKSKRDGLSDDLAG